MSESESDFSRYELMVLHRLGTLEGQAQKAHQAVEELRVELATMKSVQQTRTALIATVISAAAAAAAYLVPILTG